MIHALSAIVLLLTTPCLAGPPDSPKKAAAREEFRKANELFLAKDYESALIRFKAANSLYKHRSFLFNMAVCAEHLGRWKEAADSFDAFATMIGSEDPEYPEGIKRRDKARGQYKRSLVTVRAVSTPAKLAASMRDASGRTFGGTTPCEWVTEPGRIEVTVTRGSVVRKSAKKVPPGEEWTVTEDLTTLKAGDPEGTLRINVDVPGAEVRVNGRPVEAGKELSLPPSSYEVLISHKDYRSQKLTGEVRAFKPTVLEVRLDPASAGRPQRIAGWSVLGLGGALLINGVVFATLASQSHSQAEELISGSSTPDLDAEAELTALQQKTRTRALVADVSFGLAAAAVATGLALWLTADSGSPQDAIGEGGMMTVMRF